MQGVRGLRRTEGDLADGIAEPLLSKLQHSNELRLQWSSCGIPAEGSQPTLRILAGL